MSERKPPRDWLLARHASATSTLDTIRRSALPTPATTWREALAAIFRPHVVAWRMLAALWVGLVAFHLTLSRSPVSPPRATVPPAPEATIAWFRQLKSHETIARMDR